MYLQNRRESYSASHHALRRPRSRLSLLPLSLAISSPSLSPLFPLRCLSLVVSLRFVGLRKHRASLELPLGLFLLHFLSSCSRIIPFIFRGLCSRSGSQLVLSPFPWFLTTKSTILSFIFWSIWAHVYCSCPFFSTETPEKWITSNGYRVFLTCDNSTAGSFNFNPEDATTKQLRFKRIPDQCRHSNKLFSRPILLSSKIATKEYQDHHFFALDNA
jgi:hypothetical protein